MRHDAICGAIIHYSSRTMASPAWPRQRRWEILAPGSRQVEGRLAISMGRGGIPMEQCQLPSEIVGSQTNSVSTGTMSVHPCAVGV